MFFNDSSVELGLALVTDGGSLNLSPQRRHHRSVYMIPTNKARTKLHLLLFLYKIDIA